MTSLDVPRHPSAPHAAGIPIQTWGVEGQKALPGAAVAVLAHGGAGGKSQAPWVFTSGGHPVVILVTGQDDTFTTTITIVFGGGEIITRIPSI